MPVRSQRPPPAAPRALLGRAGAALALAAAVVLIAATPRAIDAVAVRPTAAAPDSSRSGLRVEPLPTGACPVPLDAGAPCPLPLDAELRTRALGPEPSPAKPLSPVL